MLKLTATLLCGSILTACMATTVHSQSNSSPANPSVAQTPIARLAPNKEAIASVVLQNAQTEWNFDAKGRVAKIERADLRNMGDVLWISPTIPTWKITLESRDQRLVYISNNTASINVLARRENLKLSQKVPASVIQAVQKNVAYYANPNYKNDPQALQPQQVLIQIALPKQWPDGCLGQAGPGEVCTMAMVDGWQVRAEGKTQGYITPRFTYRTDGAGQQVRVDLPAPILKSVFTTAQNWGLLEPKNAGQLVNVLGAEPTQWGEGCPARTLPMTCDPIAVSGWLVKLEQNGKRWLIRVHGDGQRSELMQRENLAIDRQLDNILTPKLRQLAATHLEVNPAQILLLNLEIKQYDSCLGLASPVEDCQVDRSQVYRVTVEGKPGERQTYRLNFKNGIRTEGSGGLPPRVDELPTRIARVVFQEAQKRLKTSMTGLRITQVEATQECYELPNQPAPPCTFKVPNGWSITVTDFQKTLLYDVGLDGKVRSVKPI